MSLFDQASICITPNGVKAGKLYSIKPTDGSGDLSVVRATSATRVDANGLIEIPRTNLALRSEEFNDASWVKERITVSANATTAPDGTLTADKVIENTDNNSHRIRQNLSSTSGLSYSLSSYIKAAGRTKARVFVGGINAYCDFDLTSGTIIGSPINCTASIQNVGDGWYRCSISYLQNTTSGAQLHLFAPLDSSGNFSYTGNGVDGIFVWGAQLEEGVTATEYIPTTTSIRTRFAGITQDGGSASNIARLDYTNGSCPSILVEPQRTNLILRSEEFDNASWVKSNITVTPNTTIAPSGTLTADTITNTLTTSFISQNTLATIGVIYTFSIYIKNIDSVSSTFLGRTNINNYNFAINWSGNIITSITNVVGTSTFTSVGNDWYRVTCTFSALETSFLNRINSSNTLTNRSVVIWGAQLEAGSNATSYIPTVASAVTRNADIGTNTLLNNLQSNNLLSNVGTFLLDTNFNLINDARTLINVGDVFGFVTLSDGRNAFRAFALGSYIGLLNTGNGNNKLLFKYNNNTVWFFRNGVLVGSLNLPFPVAPNFLSIFNASFGIGVNQKINKILAFNQVLTDQQCIDLTTL
jgi:hypothetical protein